jgi:hypothetical protein
MPGPESRRAGTRRHTLGSMPEAQEPLHPAIMPVKPALAPLHNLTDGAEPVHTIYGAGWYAARQRAHAATANGAAELVRLLDLVESGWHVLRDLQHWYESNVPRADAGDAYAQLLAFVDGDLVDVFREVAGGAAALVPGWTGWAVEADPDAVVGDVETFVRYLALVDLAVQAAPVPEPFAAQVASVAQRFTGWGTEVSALVVAIWPLIASEP